MCFPSRKTPTMARTYFKNPQHKLSVVVTGLNKDRGCVGWGGVRVCCGGDGGGVCGSGWGEAC